MTQWLCGKISSWSAIAPRAGDLSMHPMDFGRTFPPTIYPQIQMHFPQ